MRSILSILLSLFLITSTTFAAATLPNGNNLFAKANDEEITASELVNKIDSEIGGGLTGILGVLKKVGLAIAICALAFMAVQIILCPPERKAQLKEGLTPYFLGLLLLIAGVPIAIAVINVFIKVFSQN